MAALPRHRGQQQEQPPPPQHHRGRSSTGPRRLEEPSYAYPQAAQAHAYWGCALPCCGALVLSALLHQQHHHHHHQQQQWREKGANDGGRRSQQQQHAALSLLRLGVLSEVRPTDRLHTDRRSNPTEYAFAPQDEYGVVAASSAASGAAGDKGIALAALDTSAPPCTEEEETSPLPPTMCSSLSSSCSVCSSHCSFSSPASAHTEEDEEEESKEVEEQQQQEEAVGEVEVDPITLEPLGPAGGTFTLCLPQQRGLVVRYNLETLARYLVASGRFVEVRACDEIA